MLRGASRNPRSTTSSPWRRNGYPRPSTAGGSGSAHTSALPEAGVQPSGASACASSMASRSEPPAGSGAPVTAARSVTSVSCSAARPSSAVRSGRGRARPNRPPARKTRAIPIRNPASRRRNPPAPSAAAASTAPQRGTPHENCANSPSAYPSPSQASGMPTCGSRWTSAAPPAGYARSGAGAIPSRTLWESSARL